MSNRIELRSDTFTKPTKEMLAYMCSAPVGDDVFGEDPTVNALEKNAAELFGMEAALYCPSGTMTNQIGIHVHVRAGDEVICEENAHVFSYEGGGMAANSHAQARCLKGDNGLLQVQQIAAAINNPEDPHKAYSRLVCLENTSNRGGGTCYSMAEIEKIKTLTKQKGLALHLDGARLFNAMVAGNESPLQYGTLFDTVSICLSKGLGAPVGSLLLGSTEKIILARRVRKRFGGGMRQAGYLAAAGLYALQNNIDRLAADHQNANAIKETLKGLQWVKNIYPGNTNICIFEIDVNFCCAAEMVEKLAEKEIYCLAVSNSEIRMVTHLDVSESQIEQVKMALKNI